MNATRLAGERKVERGKKEEKRNQPQNWEQNQASWVRPSVRGYYVLSACHNFNCRMKRALTSITFPFSLLPSTLNYIPVKKRFLLLDILVKLARTLNVFFRSMQVSSWSPVFLRTLCTPLARVVKSFFSSSSFIPSTQHSEDCMITRLAR